MTLVYYISGHGLGHASRDIEIINAVVRSRPDVRIVVRTSAPAWFFEAFASTRIEIQRVEVDPGVTQIDSLQLDQADTARRAGQFYEGFTARVDAEAALLAELRASAAVADVPPLGIAAAHRAGIPSIALGNFTWDWIYRAYPEFDRFAPATIDVIRRAYARASCALRLPFHGGFEPMAGVMRDIPLVARHAARGRAEVRRALGLGVADTVVLSSFGGFGLPVPYADIARMNRFTLVLTDLELPRSADAALRQRTRDPHSGAAPDRLRRFETGALAEQGFRYPDLVAAADVVVSKPGYGIVSECIANGPALLYTDRGRFPEHDVFVAQMPRVLRCRFIPQEELRRGRWDAAVDALLAQPPPPDSLASNGADVAAEAILETAYC